MSQTGYTPILSYASGTASAVPLAANLTSSASGAELAVNYADGKLFYKDSGGVVQTMASKGTGSIGGATTQVQFNNAGALGGSASLTWNGTVLTSSGFAGPLNGTVGATTANTGAFTTLSASSTVSGTGFSTYLASPPAIGGTAAAAGSFTTLGASGNLTLSGGTANGVAYLNGSKVVTSGSALVFDGTNLGIGTSSPTAKLTVDTSGTSGYWERFYNSGTELAYFYFDASTLQLSSKSATRALTFLTNDTERMRLDSSGNVGIGTSSPNARLNVLTAGTRAKSLVLGGSDIGNDFVDMEFFPRQTLLSNPIARISGILTFGAGGSESGDLGFYTAASGTLTERMRIDSSGNLGLGVTPSAWSANDRVIEGYGGSGFTIASQNALFSSSNAYRNSSGVWTYKSTNPVNIFGVAGNGPSSGFQWFQAPSGTAGNPITFTQAMTLDASGNLLVGTTNNPPNSRVAIVNGTPSAASTTQHIGWGDGTKTTIMQQTGSSYSYAGVSANSMWWYLNSNWAALTIGSDGAVPITFVSNGSEKARIETSGQLLIGCTSTPGGSTNGISLINPSATQTAAPRFSAGATTSSVYQMTFINGNGFVGSITTNASATLFNISSDQRLKENIVDAPEFGNVIDAIQVRSYDWKADGNHQRAGFIAQELVTVAPEAVHQPADPEEMMAVDYSKLVPMLVKEIQDLRKRVAALEPKGFVQSFLP